MLSKKQLRAAARHARELAMEMASGWRDISYFPDPYSYCGCATAEIVKRTFRVRAFSEESPLYDAARAIDNLLRDGGRFAGEVSNALFAARRGDYDSSAVVVPLLALADELEIAAKAAPKALP